MKTGIIKSTGLHRLVLAGAIPFLAATPAWAAEGWRDVSSRLLERLTNNGVKVGWPGGCSGVVANRLTGEVTIKVIGAGLWRSADKGVTWKRVDQDVISGRDETGWATTVDQNAPNRMASFSLDGMAGWTMDGTNWNRFTSLGRNWDFGSVDWAAAVPATIIAAKHETTPAGEVYITADGGKAWKKLAIYIGGNRGKTSMVGAMDASTFVYSKGEGIYRSTDSGEHWIQVSSAQPQTRIPVLFGGAHYLGTGTGLLVSKDKGATWQTQGSPVNIWLGPFFGKDEKEMVVVGKEGAFKTTNGGESWRRVAEPKAKERGFLFTANWFGCYAWDPVNEVLYVSAMGNPVYAWEMR